MTDAEWNYKKDDVVVEVGNIHTDQQLSDFIAKEYGIRDSYDTVQYKFFLIPDY